MYKFLNADHYPFMAYIKNDSEELRFAPNPLMADAIFKLFSRDSKEFHTLNNAFNLIAKECVNDAFLQQINNEENNIIIHRLIDNKLKIMGEMWFNLASTNTELYKADDMVFEYIDDSLKVK